MSADDLDGLLQSVRDIHRDEGRELTKIEVVEFINRKIDMGFPQPRAAKGRGRKPTRTQYDESLERRRNIYHLFVRLPKHHRLQKNDTDHTMHMIEQLAKELVEKGQRITQGTIGFAWLRRHKTVKPPHRTTIGRYLKRLKNTRCRSIN